MKLTITQYDTTYSLETDKDDVGLVELLDRFKGLLVTAGFHPESVDQAIQTECQWFDQSTTDTSMVYPGDFEAKH